MKKNYAYYVLTVITFFITAFSFAITYQNDNLKIAYNNVFICFVDNEFEFKTNSFVNKNEVINILAPNVICQDITVYLDSTGNVLIAEDAVDNGSTGNGTLIFDTDKTDFDCSNVGAPVNVTLTGT